MKIKICFAIMLSMLTILNGCSKDDNNPTAPTVVAIENWNFILNDNSSNHGQTTFEKKSDGSISEKSDWYFVYEGATVQCPFEGGKVTIADTAISFTAQGTATNPDAPAGYQKSAFTVNVSGFAHNGNSSGTWNITFLTEGWPSNLEGIFLATRKSGSGITN
jgi:hypothetical protein